MSETLTKLKDVMIYRDEGCYSHNATAALAPDGELLVVVQEQKRRRVRTHVDPTSRPVLVASADEGESWHVVSRNIVEPGDAVAVNDPGLTRLKDGTLIITYFVWQLGGDEEVPPDNPWVRRLDGIHYAWMAGTYTVRSTDGGATWEEPVRVEAPTGDATAVSDPVVELPDGELLIPLYAGRPGEMEHVLLMRSTDQGRSWHGPTIVADDPFNRMRFAEPSLLHLPSGRLVCMHRVHLQPEQEYGHYLYQSESDDMGKTWTAPHKTPIWGHPPHLLRLESGAVLCVYGYRRPPYGVRACLSHDECATWDIRNELVLRNDGPDGDVGYPTSVQLADGRIFTVWYMTEAQAGAQGVGHSAVFGAGSTLGYIGGSFYRET